MTTAPKPRFPGDPPLLRFPVLRNDPLQAWDAADELLLEHAETLALGDRRVLVAGDSFGALARGLAHAFPSAVLVSYTDSYLSARGIAANTGGRAEPISRLEDLRGPFDAVFLRVPKNLSFLEDLLARISGELAPGAPLVAGVMVKHQADGAFDLIGRLFGETRTSLAKKKARLILAEFSRSPVVSPYPLRVEMPGFPHPFVNHSNVFSRERLDVGTRFFLDHLPAGVSGTILDLGCGNGIVGIAAKRENPGARIVFTDESRMAVASAEANYREAFPGDASAEFRWTNAYAEGADASVDLVLCNPPFHQGNTVGDFIAREMFRESARVLRPGGRLRVIGNSHLTYPGDLRRRFGNAKVVAKNAKFTIVDAIRN